MKTGIALLMGVGILLNGFGAGINLLHVALTLWFGSFIEWPFLGLAILNGILAILCYDYIQRIEE
jgi:hypothetical protein